VQDAATGLVYMQQRYYDAQIGRFLSVDPIVADAATGSGFNRYVYGNSNPFKFTDPDGRSAVTLGRIVATVSYETATKLGAAALGSYLGLALYDVLHQEEEATSDEPSSAPEPGTPDSDMGCIYRCDGVSEGQETPSGKPYVGSADDKKKRAQTARDGRDRENAETIGEYKKGDRKGRQEAEQKGMNENGGKDNLDNKRNEVREDKWKDRDIPPPKKL
jgi:RHS repeat-associated protein